MRKHKRTITEYQAGKWTTKKPIAVVVMEDGEHGPSGTVLSCHLDQKKAEKAQRKMSGWTKVVRLGEYAPVDTGVASDV